MSVLRMVRGDARQFTITVTDSDGVAVDISTYTVALAARRGYDSPVIFEKELGLGLEFGAGTGEVVLSVDPADTVGLPAATTELVWDCEVTDVNGDPQTPVTGVLRVYPDATYAGGS